jgi:hypothetical protein
MLQKTKKKSAATSSASKRTFKMSKVSQLRFLAVAQNPKLTDKRYSFRTHRVAIISEFAALGLIPVQEELKST